MDTIILFRLFIEYPIYWTNKFYCFKFRSRFNSHMVFYNSEYTENVTLCDVLLALIDYVILLCYFYKKGAT
jgi:hypothetical protein